MGKIPPVSIGILTYNRADRLAKTIKSLLNQTYSDFELIICDDASNDNTPGVMALIDDARVRYLRHPKNIGSYQNWNSAIQASRGEYIAVYHDHDIYSPGLIECCVKALDKDRRLGFVHFSKYILDVSGRVIMRTQLPLPDIMEGRNLARYIARGWDLRLSNFGMVRRSIFEQAGLVDERFGLSADYDLWGRLALVSDRVGYIREPLVAQMGRESDNPVNSRKHYWTGIEGNVIARRNLVDRCYPGSSWRDRYERIKVRAGNDRFILMSLLYATCFPGELPVGEGLSLAERQGAYYAKWLAPFIPRLNNLPFMKSMARIYSSYVKRGRLTDVHVKRISKPPREKWVEI
jgi:glycosyltransferase involved in cell wall biosynthesis